MDRRRRTTPASPSTYSGYANVVQQSPSLRPHSRGARCVGQVNDLSDTISRTMAIGHPDPMLSNAACSLCGAELPAAGDECRVCGSRQDREETIECQIECRRRRSRGEFVAVTSSDGSWEIMACSRTFKWDRYASSPTPTPEAQRRLEELSARLREDGWEHSGSGVLVAWYAHRFIRVKQPALVDASSPSESGGSTSKPLLHAASTSAPPTPDVEDAAGLIEQSSGTGLRRALSGRRRGEEKSEDATVDTRESVATSTVGDERTSSREPEPEDDPNEQWCWVPRPPRRSYDGDSELCARIDAYTVAAA